MRKLLIVSLIAMLFVGVVGPAEAFVIGGFDLARGGILSIEFGSVTGNFRAHVAATFPGTTYRSANTLTDAFLSNIDVLIIVAATGFFTPIALLSPAEQTALLNFIAGGGSALLFTDNDIQFEPASDSMVSPFGLDADGVIRGSATSTVTMSHPVTTGPFGAVTTIDHVTFPGWYPTLGPNAIALARLDLNGQVSLAVINRGPLAPASGAVVFFSDVTIFNDNYTGSMVTLIDNAVAYAASLSAPTANAGQDQTVDEGTLVAMDGSASTGQNLAFNWSQLVGPPVQLNDPSRPAPSFLAPLLPGGFGSQTLTFQLSVTSAGESSTDTVDVLVRNVNHPPVADAGGDQVVNEGSVVTLSGAFSFDPEGDPLTFTWTQTGGTPVTLSDADTANPTFTAPVLAGGIGASTVLDFTVTVFDGALSGSAGVRVTVEQVNHPPVADAGPPPTVLSGNLVTLDASASFDQDGDPLAFSWSQIGGPAVTLANVTATNPSFVAPAVPGTTTLTFRVIVSDTQLTGEPADVAVTVKNGPPLCHLARAVPDLLWPPNHRMIPVSISGVSDPDDDGVIVNVAGVTQDEPVNGLGDGDTSPDAVIQPTHVLLRAERSGRHNGRVYEIRFTADDGHGGSCNGSVKVGVPKSLGHGSEPIDDGQVFDSAQP